MSQAYGQAQMWYLRRRVGMVMTLGLKYLPSIHNVKLRVSVRRMHATDADAISVSRAMENECFVCMCNAAESVGQGASRLGLGRSSVNAPLLGCSDRVPHWDEALLFATLDTKVLLTARKYYRIRHDLTQSFFNL